MTILVDKQRNIERKVIEMDRMVDFSKGDVVKLYSNKVIDFCHIAQNNEFKKRYRYCMQDSCNSVLQDMFICRSFGDYCRPDRHEGIPESHTIIDGKELIVLFSDNGEIIDHFILDRGNGVLCYRINSAVYHMTIVLSSTAIDYEVKLGPFDETKMDYPSWAPCGDSHEENGKYLQEITKKLGVNYVGCQTI